MDFLEKHYIDYGSRARELSQQGKKVVGYLCSYSPIEMITATGMIPFRLRGDIRETITLGDTEMETIVCSVVRSIFDLSMKGKFDFIDGLVIPHACDSICRSYEIWKNAISLPYYHLLNVPHSIDGSSIEFFKSVLGTFRDSLGRFSGQPVSDSSLVQAIKMHNTCRSMVKQLYELRRMNPPLVAGSEITKALVSISSLPVNEGIELLSRLIGEIRHRSVRTLKRPRIMVSGAVIDHIDFIQLIEDSGADVVTDDLCPGTRDYFPEVELTNDPIDGLARRYLVDINCGRTYREMHGSYDKYLEDRFGHIGRMANEYGVNGLVLLVYRYCDPYGFEVPQLKSYLENMNIPVLYIEDEYSLASRARLRTRIEAFIESLSHGQ